MARSAAAKKVAKAASTGGGGRSFRARRDILFPASMLLVVLLGVVLILVARDERSGNAPAGPPRLDDHWHSLYTIYECDDFVSDLYPNDADDRSGIHTHGDGLIHIHPFHTGVTGQFATIGAFMSEIEAEFDDATLGLPDGTILSESDAQCASPDPDSDDPNVSEPGAQLRVMRWESVQAEKALGFDENLRDVRFLGDGQMFVFAMVHPSVDNVDIPRPDDAFLRSYLQIPAEDQPLADTSLEEGPTLIDPNDDGSVDEPAAPPDDVPETEEPGSEEPGAEEPETDAPETDAPVTDEPASDGAGDESSMADDSAHATS